MAVTQRMDLRQSQSLVMTPQLQQAIKLLELSNLELSDYIERELEQNPLLERDEEGRSDFEHDSEGDGAQAESANADLTDSADFATSDVLAASADLPLDTDYDNLWSDDSAAVAPSSSLNGWDSGGRGGSADEGSGLEQTLGSAINLRDHLLAQLGLSITDPTDRMIGLQLIDMIDEAGYLGGDLEQVAELLGCTVARVEATLAKLQEFDPAGIFARSLAECLALQLRDRNRLDPAMQALLDNLHLLASRDREALMRVCGIDGEDLVEMVAEIKALNPKPALAYEMVVTSPVTPDILMHRQSAGEWIIELNSETLPRVLVNNAYVARISREAKGKAERDYITERLNSANWLVKSLHQRATTILKVATEIVRQQEAFFLHGVQHLKPLIRRDIATAIGMHESTVSRVTTNKYLATPRGVYELKYFFTASLAHANGGDAHSAEAVRSRIKHLIETETADAILSDDRLVELLHGDGITIARRTVAKYRESLRIPSSVQRRRDKTLRIG
ncbi:RNA polymerase factor sigma-54 [Rhodospirillaceae bacterium SYSU D60014]|uniref:RNA polymerase factor sigma-54 n=1 Tax=Virgifigura deserti TaxID=2268457 RepID=UPI000E66A65B